MSTADLTAFTEPLPADRKSVDANSLAKQLVSTKKLSSLTVAAGLEREGLWGRIDGATCQPKC